MNRTCYIELLGVSGSGKSFIFKKLKQKLPDNDKYHFIDKCNYKKRQLIHPVLLLSSIFKISKCKLLFTKHFLKYLKLWYFTQLFLYREASSYKPFVIIDEGTFHRARAIRHYSPVTNNKVRKVLFKGNTIITDIVININTSPEIIHQFRESRGTRAINIPVNEIYEEISISAIGTREDIEFVNNNIKDVLFINIDYNGNNLDTVIDEIHQTISNQ